MFKICGEVLSPGHRGRGLRPTSALRPCLPGPTSTSTGHTVYPRARYPLGHLVCDTLSHLWHSHGGSLHNSTANIRTGNILAKANSLG